MSEANSVSTFSGRYEPVGWIQWPDQPELSFQFARALGAAQENASTISECFLAASRMTTGDTESWYREWRRLGQVHHKKAEDAEAKGRLASAMSGWLRAANYYRSSEFYLKKDDPRRMANFDTIEACSRRYLALMNPVGEVVSIPYENGAHLDSYFLPAPFPGPRPTIVSFGGLDEYKDEQLHDLTRHAFARGMSLLLVELPGQGGTLRRQNLVNRYDTEVPVSCCYDYLLTRSDVDHDRIALYGASMGGYYSARAASFEHRFKAAVSDCIIFDANAGMTARMMNPDLLIWMHLKWVYGADTIEEVSEKSKAFNLRGAIDKIRCPFLIVHAEHDFIPLETAVEAFDYAKSHGVDVSMKVFMAEETGASHCQVDNPTFGMEYVFDWLAEKLGIDEVALRRTKVVLAR